MMEWLKKILGKTGGSGPEAKKRLQLVLIHDRTDLTPEMLESMRRDLVAIIGRYLNIDETAVEMGLEREDRSVALVASIPILSAKRSGSAEKLK